MRLKNTAASVAVIVLSCSIFAVSPYNAKLLARYHGPPEFAFNGYQFLGWAAAIYTVLVALYFAFDDEPTASKSLRFFNVLGRLAREPVTTVRRGLDSGDRLAVLTTLLKGFFAPMMTVSLMVFCMGAWSNGAVIVHHGLLDGSFREFFDRAGFWMVMQAILFLDVLVFTVGYLLESRRLGNQIRSVDPTLLGWGAALLCYPPFNAISGLLLGSQYSDFPQFENSNVHLTLNLLLLALMAAYTSASLALGLKASNLTHRGIVTRGPYALIRHPAYVFKNMAWWIGSVPLLTLAFDKSPADGLQALASVVGTTLLYVLRALTEEDHLRTVDGTYAEYASRVRYRFIPGLL